MSRRSRRDKSLRKKVSRRARWLVEKYYSHDRFWTEFLIGSQSRYVEPVGLSTLEYLEIKGDGNG